MKIKFNFFTLILILCIILSVSSVSASDDMASDEALDPSLAGTSISEISEDDSNSISDSNGMIQDGESSNDDAIVHGGDDLLKDDSTLSFSDLAELINGHTEGNLTIEGTYVYDDSRDSEYKNGIVIKNDDEKNFTIIGNDLVINGNNQARAFNISALGHITLKSITFVNCSSEENGGAIYTTSPDLFITSANFICNSAKVGGSVFNDGGNVHFAANIYNSSLALHQGKFTGNLTLYNSGLTNYEGIVTADSLIFEADEGITNNLTNLNGIFFARNATFNKTNFVSENGEVIFGEISKDIDEEGNVKIISSGAQFYNSNFNLTGGTYYHLGANYATTLSLENVSSTIGDVYVYSNSTGQLNSYEYATYFNNCDLSNVGGSINHIGSVHDSNISNEYGVIKLGGIIYLDMEAKQIIFSHLNECKNSNITNIHGNLTGYGYFTDSNIVNNLGSLFFPAYSSYKLYYSDSDNYAQPHYEYGCNPVRLSNSNITNDGGNIISEGADFSNFNLVNAYGNIIISAVNPIQELGNEKISKDFSPSFKNGNITNLGNFTSESGDFSELNLTNDGIFNVSNFTFEYLHIDSDTGVSTLNSTITKGCFYGNNVTNKGNMSLDLASMRSNNFNNTASVMANSTWTDDNKFTNEGVFSIREVYFSEKEIAFDNNLMYNNTFVNHGSFMIAGNSTYLCNNEDGDEPIVYDGFSSIINYGNFMFDGGDSHSELVNYTLSNYGIFNWVNINTTPSVTVDNFGNLRISGGSLINGTPFNGYGTNGNITVEGANAFVNTNVLGNDFFNKGQTTFDGLRFENCHVSNYADLDVKNSYFSNGEILNFDGVMSMFNSSANLCNLTVNGGTLNSNSNNLLVQTKNRGRMTSSNDNFTASYDFFSRYNYYCIVSYNELLIDNADLPSIPIYNIGGYMSISNSSIKQGAIHNYGGGYVLLYQNTHFNNDTVLNHMGRLDSINETYNESIFKIARLGDTYVYNSTLQTIFLNQTAGNLTFVNCSVSDVNISNYNRANIAFEGDCSLSDSYGSGGSLINRGNLNVTNLQFEGNGAKKTGIRNYAEMNVTDSSISNINITNEGNLSLFNAGLDNIDIINRCLLNAYGGSAKAVKVFNDSGEISAVSSDIASNVVDVSPIVAKNLTTDYNSGVYFGVNYTDEYGNKLDGVYVTMIIDGKDYYTKTDSEGHAFINKQLAGGKHSVVVINPITLQNKTYSVNINKLPTKVSVNKIVEYYGARKYLVIKISDSKGKPVKGIRFLVKFNNKVYKLTSNSKGVARYRIPILKIGKYKVTVNASHKGYLVKTVKSTIKVNKAKTSVYAPKITRSYKKSKYFKFKVKSKVTKKAVKNIKVKVKIYTGKKYKAYILKTNKKGIAQINTKTLKRGSHKVVISSLDKNYKISKKSSIRIK